jgi:hypothetical protein
VYLFIIFNTKKLRRLFMKKLTLVFVCLLIVLTGMASERNQGDDGISTISSTEGQPVYRTLEELNAYEKSNAIIDIECEEKFRAEAGIIEETWNSGKYEEAIELLKNSLALENAALGIQWKEPVKAPAIRWAGDVRVGTRDSIEVVDLDVDIATGHLFAVIKYQSSGSRWAVNFSADTGKTWTETYTWGASTVDVDGAVLGDYFYAAYSTTTNFGRIRRFNTGDGSPDHTYNSPYGYITVIDEGVALREIVLISNPEHSNPSSRYLFYFSVMGNDSLRFFYSNNATAWTKPATLNTIADVSRGLDACCAIPNKLWASFIGTDNNLYIIGGWASWTTYNTGYSFGTVSPIVTSAGAYGDTVAVVFPYSLSPGSHDVRFYITTTSGNSWGIGTLLFDSPINSYVNDVTARGGDGFGFVYQTSGPNAEGVYRHRNYSSSALTLPVSFADNVPRQTIKPSIERIADGIYGILYVNYPEETAWFDRSDWLTPDGLSLSPDEQTIEFGDTLELTAYLEKDASGVEGEELNFAVITGDGSLDPASGVTNASGEVQTDFIAGSTAEVVTVEVTWVSINQFDTLSATVDIEVVASGGITESPDVSGISAVFGSGEILCAVAKEGEVTVKVYDKMGREAGTLLNGKVKRGYYPLSLKNLNLASDIYFVVMRGQEIDQKIKVTLIN